MTTFLITLIIITCVLLVIVVLVQNSKGGGLASNFSASNQVMGVKKTSELIEKITWGLAIALVVLSILTSFVSTGGKVQAGDTELREKVDNVALPQQPQQQPAQQQAAPAQQQTPAQK